MEQMAFAMEIFALAQEYSHHSLSHGRSAPNASDLPRGHQLEEAGSLEAGGRIRLLSQHLIREIGFQRLLLHHFPRTLLLVA
jgi:hypothetical protein